MKKQILFFSLAFVTGCGAPKNNATQIPSDGSMIGKCEETKSSGTYCTDYRVVPSISEALLPTLRQVFEKECTKINGTFSNAFCSTQNVSGICSIESVQSGFTIKGRALLPSSIPREAGEQACAGKGTFSVP